jgi:hypothetical protein
VTSRVWAHDLALSQESLRVQFEDFLTEHYISTKNMNETQFLSFVINLPFDGYFDDFIRSVTFELANLKCLSNTCCASYNQC